MDSLLSELFWRWCPTGKEDDCWLWQGPLTVKGYGYFISPLTGKLWYAHRLSWMLANSDDLKGLCILHKCDVPRCVNPSHLSPGTYRQNTLDCISKRRHGSFTHPAPPRPPHLSRLERLARGDAAYSHKLNLDQVRQIRKLHQEGRSYSKLAREFEIDQSMVSLIVNRKRWAEVE